MSSSESEAWISCRESAPPITNSLSRTMVLKSPGLSKRTRPSASAFSNPARKPSMMRSSSSFESATAVARSSTSFWSACAWMRAFACFRRRRQLCSFEYLAMSVVETSKRSARSR